MPGSQGEVVLPFPRMQALRCLDVSWAKQQRNCPPHALQSPCRAASLHECCWIRLATPMSTGDTDVQPRELLPLPCKISLCFLAYMASGWTFFPGNIPAMSHRADPVLREMFPPILGHSPCSQAMLWTGRGSQISCTHFWWDGGITWIIAFNCPFKGFPQGD